MAAEYNDHFQILLACSAQDSKLLPKPKKTASSTEQTKLNNQAMFEKYTGKPITKARQKLSDGI